MPHKFLALIFALLCLSRPAHSKLDLKEASVTSRWLRLYQYERHGRNYVSDVTSERFFFSPQGRRDPLAELEAAIKAYENPELKFGTQKDSAACVFPVRKKALEALLDRSFPSPPCPDLESWVSRIGADQVSLVFVGAYPGNPASILGHSFLRLSNREREASGRDGVDLLSYSLGYIALTDPRDNRMMYMLKGLSGGYPGFYEIEPHYIKVGLYNNSESRDLWDLNLDFTTEEVDLLVRHYWELTFNSSFDYFFIDENCSYRLLTLLEAIRPEIDLTSRFSAVVLPAETVRAAIDAGLATGEPKFRPSVKRRMEYKLSLLAPENVDAFKRARSSLHETKALYDATAVDALLDHWLYQNYKAKAQLDETSQALMEATYTRASELRIPSRFQVVTNERIREEGELAPPFTGHEPSWIELRAGATTRSSLAGLTYRNGTHPFWSGDKGYDDISGIEYLGFDLEAAKDEATRWSLLLAKATAYEDFFSVSRGLSWSFEGKVTNSFEIGPTGAVT
ncbi:MAG: DUF4105 domain-containing protein, partial [Bdellovibrionota bacterium]